VRGGFVSRLRQAIEAGRLPRIEDSAQIDAVLDALMATDWAVYSKPCITHTETVVAYLGRYSHRIALSDARILNFTDGQVDLAYKDYRDGQNKVMHLDAEELLRRYLLHVLPKGFMRCRHFGFLANRCRRQRLAQIRAAIAARAAERAREPCENTETPFDGWPCPTCRHRPQRLPAGHHAPRRLRQPAVPEIQSPFYKRSVPGPRRTARSGLVQQTFIRHAPERRRSGQGL
jgi:hypothetical protein